MAAVRVVPTLAVMQEVYSLPREGGPSSPRFQRYVELGRQVVPISGYNPMTSKDVLGTIDALLAMDAERLVAEAAGAVLDEMALDGDFQITVVVATPGMWTDRVATEIQHRFGGRRPGEILVWTGEEVDADSVRMEARAQAVREAWALLHGQPARVVDVTAREGLAYAATGREEDVSDPAVAAALDVVGDDTALATSAALLYGDEVARQMGWTPLGIAPWTGYRHCIARAGEALAESSIAQLVRQRGR